MEQSCRVVAALAHRHRLAHSANWLDPLNHLITQEVPPAVCEREWLLASLADLLSLVES